MNLLYVRSNVIDGLVVDGGDKRYGIWLHDTMSPSLGYDVEIQDIPMTGVGANSVIGTEGKIFWDYYGGSVELRRFNLERPDLHRFDRLQRNQMFVSELEHFFSCIRTEARPIVGLREAVKSLTLALAVRRSMASGKVVNLE